MFNRYIISNTKTIQKGTFVKMKTMFFKWYGCQQLYAMISAEASINFYLLYCPGLLPFDVLYFFI